MIFRPEEMNTASGERPVFCPLSQRDINISMDSDRVFFLYDAIAHNNLYWLTAIQTGRINLDRLSWKCPADRQGFETSLAIPFLLSFDSNTVLRRQIVERGK
jgi:hypothetical protein